MRPSRLILSLTIVFMIIWGVYEVRANYEFENQIGSYWSLGVKASTLQQKTTYLDKYIAAIEAQHMEGMHDAVYLQTPDNAYDDNMVALKSLQGRMHQIQGMDEQSFAYQTAIQQITAQEQGQADKLTATFEGCWFLRNNTLLWGWHDIIIWILMIVIGIVSACFAFADNF